MADNNQFISELTSAIENKKEELNNKILLKLQENYNIQSSAVQSVRSILLEKRLIHNDPYKYDSKMTEIEIPSRDEFMDSEKASILGSRLAQYGMMLNFLITSYRFNSDFLNPKRIPKLMELNNTFLWTNFTNTSNHINTKRLADIVQTVFTSSDKLGAGLIRDSLTHLAKAANEINNQLKELSFFHKEAYKLLIRKEILPEVSIKQEDLSNPGKILKDIKKVFVSKSKKIPFYNDLIIETLKEDYTDNGQSLREENLRKLFSSKKEDSKNIETENHRKTLISGFKFIGSTTPHLKAAFEKIGYNQDLIYRSNIGFFSKLLKLMRQAFNMKEPEREITIITEDPVTHNKKKHVINYNQFEKEINTKIKVFSGLSFDESVIKQKLKNFEDDVLLNYLTRYISDCNIFLKQLAGLDEFYKSVKPELRGKVRGIKIEITTITNAVLKANQCRAEFGAFLEESEQMKKLGIV